ncbi:MAG: hypothetical protein WCI27_05195 [Candidatus Omnitrophota bacterium]
MMAYWPPSEQDDLSADEIKIDYAVDRQGGIYHIPLVEKGVRFQQLWEFIDKHRNVKRLVLICRKDSGRLSNKNKVFAELEKIKERAFRDNFIYEHRNAWPVCDGYQTTICNQGNPDVKIVIEKDRYILGRRMSVVVSNMSSADEQYVPFVSVEKQVGAGWRDVLFDIGCGGCRIECDRMGDVLSPGTNKIFLWDQESGEPWDKEGPALGCAKRPGRYRFKFIVIKTIPKSCLSYDDQVYSREFELYE